MTATTLRGPVKLVDGAGGNIVALVGEDGLLLVDTGIAVARDRIAAALGGFDGQRLRYVVNTHRHADHTSGNSAWREAYPQADFIAHPFTREELTMKGDATLKEWAEGVPGLAAGLRQALAEGKTLAGGPLSATRTSLTASRASLLSSKPDPATRTVPVTLPPAVPLATRTEPEKLLIVTTPVGAAWDVKTNVVVALSVQAPSETSAITDIIGERRSMREPAARGEPGT